MKRHNISKLATIWRTTVKVIKKRPITTYLLMLILLIGIGAYIYYLRFPYAYSSSNFYAEDGKVFISNLINKGPIEGSLTLFNGYLIIGEYIVGIFAQFINLIFGHGFVTLAKAVSVASYVFFGVVCALPWILFRKRLGYVLSLIIVLLLWITPLGSYDYAVIGTIGNLKFAFIFIATLLMLYRIDPYLCNRSWKAIITDVLFLVCVLTNIVSLGLLPILIWHYRKEIKEFARNPRKIKIIYRPELVSAIILCLISVAYFLTVYLHGIPKLPGYLDGPLEKQSFIPLLYRNTIYGLSFPVNYLFNSFIATFLLLVSFVYAVISKERKVLLIIMYAILISIIGFVVNRPGVTSFFAAFSDIGWPSQFFYAGTMLFVFGAGISVVGVFNNLRISKQFIGLGLIITFVVLVMPAAGFSKANPYTTGISRPTLASEVSRVCREHNKQVTINIDPSVEWNMSLKRSQVCS